MTKKIFDEPASWKEKQLLESPLITNFDHI